MSVADLDQLKIELYASSDAAVKAALNYMRESDEELRLNRACTIHKLDEEIKAKHQQAVTRTRETHTVYQDKNAAYLAAHKAYDSLWVELKPPGYFREDLLFILIHIGFYNE
jgi:hypothetical protein